MRRRPFILFALGALAVIFVSVNAIAGVLFRGARVDLTADKIYSTSSGVDAVVADLAEPVSLTFFYSRGLAQDYPQIRAYGARVRELLQALADRSNGQLRLEIVDPEPFSEAEDRAIAAGLRGAPTQGGETLYFGLLARSTLDERGVIAFFNPENEPYLEYDIARLLTDLSETGAPKVALLTSLPLETVPDPSAPGPAAPQPIFLYRELLGSFEVEQLDRDFETIPDDADLLVIAHPWELDPVQLFAVDQYVIMHGRALVLVDPYSRLSQAPGPTGFPDLDAVRTSNLEPLFASWGIDYDAENLVLDRANARTAAVREDGRTVERAYPVWFTASPDQVSTADLATAALTRGVTFAAAGRLAPIEGARTTFEPLIWTTDDSELIPLEDAVEAEPRDLLDDFEPEQSYVVAARVAGPVLSAYADGIPEDVTSTDIVVERGDIQVIVVGDADVVDDTFYVQRDPLFGDTTHADNATFILNAIDVLAGSSALVGMRSRARSDRPMTRIDALRDKAEEQYYAEQTRLEQELAGAEQRLAELEAQTRGASGALGDVDAAAARQAEREVARVRDTVLTTRERLRSIERSYRSDIERLEAVVIFLNVWLLPGLIAAVGIAIFVMRRRASGANA